jgi:predicted secreted protein
VDTGAAGNRPEKKRLAWSLLPLYCCANVFYSLAQSRAKVNELLREKFMKPFSLSLLLSFLALFLAGPAVATEEINYNIVNLSAERSRQVENDVMVVLLRTVAEADRAADAARKVNEQQAWADEIIKPVEAVSYRTMQYQTHPLYQNRQISGWSVSQQIRLESTDIEGLTALVGTLQERLQISSMQFEISPDRRKKESDALTVEALQAFRNRAEMISQALGAGDYRLVTISVQENNNPAPYFRVQAEAMAAQAPAPPVVEAGDSQVMVSVSGSIQLIF